MRRTVTEIQQMITALQSEMVDVKNGVKLFRVHKRPGNKNPMSLMGPSRETGTYTKSRGGRMFDFTLSGMSSKRAVALEEELNAYFAYILKQDWFKERYLNNLVTGELFD